MLIAKRRHPRIVAYGWGGHIANPMAWQIRLKMIFGEEFGSPVGSDNRQRYPYS